MKNEIKWHAMTTREKSEIVATHLGSDSHSYARPHYAEDLGSIINALRRLKIGFDLTSDRGGCSLCIAQVGPDSETHSSVMMIPAEALCVAFLRFMGNNVQTVPPEQLAVKS